MPYYCTVPRCTSMAGKAKNVSFHQFPRDEQLAKLWNNILKRGKPYTKYSKVCSLHFKPEDYTITSVGKNKGQWRTLRKDAIPSQNLPLESPSYCRQQNPAALSSNDPSPDPQVIESQMRQMANIIYMQTMLAMQASNPRDANINESESASTTQGSEPNENGEPLVLQTSQSNLNLGQLSRLPPFANFSNNDQSDNSNIGMPRSFKCNECFRLFKDPDVFLLHKRGHAKKENASEKENKNINSIEKTQETLRANPILANLLNSNMADKMQSIFNPNHISTIDNQIMAALAINMEVFIRNLSSVNEKKSDDDSNESDNESENGEVDEKSDLAVSCDENNDECDEELKGDGVKNGDDCVKLEETVKSDCVINEST